ncbi:DNA-3-methyladenine glycosylase [Carcharodon carcharias]|uniref:DNA-3-methyladenine glycosylase n=1 Tax=Carcharodon carcharias TaxID=13397 RepID=UPI001B7EFCC8|nr:DNA-3-methyladenine glycosylase [Carcharodon carcharias]
MGPKKRRPVAARLLETRSGLCAELKPGLGAELESGRRRQEEEEEEAGTGTGTGTGTVSSAYFTTQVADGRLSAGFFNRPCVTLAKEFLGQVMVRKFPDGSEVKGRIVETEAYLGGEDQASHSRGGRQTPRNGAMFMAPGTMYVYQIYGVYFCLNVSSQGDGAAVLLRSLEPLQGLDAMRQFRSKRRKDTGKPLKDHELCNGPSKLCQALDITKTFDRGDLATGTEIWMEPGPGKISGADIVSTSRIGIGYAGEWVRKPLRFYIKGNKCVSVVDRKAEKVND